MKKSLLFIILISLTLGISAQSWLPKVEEMAKEKEELTFFDIQKTVNDHYSAKNFNDGYYLNDDGTKTKVPGWKQFKRWECYWNSRVNIQTG
ncbi:MAG: hypothetical protein C0597_10465 [Marinilabiliales bacterium]|nr:MAG: hypothetical protein C0597_10465 [Marinilabiliales bacterium]